MPLISIITPASRGVNHLSHLIRDFRNQTLPKNQWEHIIVYDGNPSDEVKTFMDLHRNDYNLKFSWIKKDSGNMKESPGTNPRNYGISIAQSPYCYFFDDDDRARDSLLESFASHVSENTIVIVQMSCSEARMFRNGDPNRIRLVPEIGLYQFPVMCHVGTPCFCLPTKWAVAEPWRHEPEHDFRFIKRICDRFHPNIQIVGGMQIDVDGLVIKGMKDWVSNPPYYR